MPPLRENKWAVLSLKHIKFDPWVFYNNFKDENFAQFSCWNSDTKKSCAKFDAFSSQNSSFIFLPVEGTKHQKS